MIKYFSEINNINRPTKSKNIRKEISTCKVMISHVIIDQPYKLMKIDSEA